MSDLTSPSPPEPGTRPDLHELARLLRTARHLRPEDQRTLSELLDELAEALRPGVAPSPEAGRLAQTAAQLAESLHRRSEPGLVGAARDRLEQAAVQAENEAPVATGIIWRLIDALANLGI